MAPHPSPRRCRSCALRATVHGDSFFSTTRTTRPGLPQHAQQITRALSSHSRASAASRGTVITVHDKSAGGCSALGADGAVATCGKHHARR